MKKITAVLLCAVIVCSFASCKGKTSEITADTDVDTVIANDPSKPTGAVTSVYDNVSIHEGFPGVCSISYDLGKTKISLIRTEKGIYISSGESEMLFIKTSGGYATYLKGEDGVFEISEAAQELADGYMNQYISTFSNFCYAHEENFNDMTKGGKTSVCDRPCTEYTYELKNDSSEYRYVYTLDDETGICMKYYLEGTDEDGEGGVYEYVCTDFTLTGVQLPEYR